MKSSLYQKILSDKFTVLPEKVKQLHNHTENASYKGECNIKRGENFISNILANILSLPKAGSDVDVQVNFEIYKNKEVWNRKFGDSKFQSTQWQVGSFLYEKLNFTTLVFDVVATEKSLSLDLKQVKILGIPMIKLLSPKVVAIETELDKKFNFNVKTELPIIGLLIEYKGWLELENA